MQTRCRERERERAHVDERACEYGEKCRRDMKTFLDHETECYSTILWFISEMYELRCRLESVLIMTKTVFI